MLKSTHTVQRLYIFAFCLLGVAACHHSDSKKQANGPVTNESQTRNTISSQNEDALVCAFFGLDNALPLRANALAMGAFGKDGMPLNFKDEMDPDTLDADDFLVIDGAGGQHVPIAATLRPADEAGENRTVLLIGEFGNNGSNPPVEIRIVGDLHTKAKNEHASAPSKARNLKNTSTRKIIPLREGPGMFFAQIIKGNLAEETEDNVQVVQVAWQGGITPTDPNIAEKDLFRFYTVYTSHDGELAPLTPKSISDINDGDNYHQLLVETQLPIVKVTMAAGVVKDPNGDPNPPTEVLLEH
ncbi:MAG: hypothetical protein LR011_07075 [Verrucomicrobia bacterium]|nr:hypothetical protein [Verrucomicrobiota bacterium]